MLPPVPPEVDAAVTVRLVVSLAVVPSFAVSVTVKVYVPVVVGVNVAVALPVESGPLVAAVIAVPLVWTQLRLLTVLP